MGGGSYSVTNARFSAATSGYATKSTHDILGAGFRGGNSH